MTITRLGNMASIVIGTGLWSLVAYMLIHAAANHAFDPAQLWNTRGTFEVITGKVSAQAHHLIRCEGCEGLNRASEPAQRL